MASRGDGISRRGGSKNGNRSSSRMENRSGCVLLLIGSAKTIDAFGSRSMFDCIYFMAYFTTAIFISFRSVVPFTVLIT